MAGNEFLNFFILSIIELPTGFLGGYLVERTGRRWTQVVFFTFCMLGFTIAAVGVFLSSAILIIIAVVISK
jgi:cyanate permease